MPDINFHRNLDSLIVLLNHLLKTKKEYKNFIKETVDARYVYQNELNKLYLQHIWLMDILKSYKEEQLLVKCYVISI